MLLVIADVSEQIPPSCLKLVIETHRHRLIDQ